MRTTELPSGAWCRCWAWGPGAWAASRTGARAKPAQIALRWVLRREHVIAIPKASTVADVEQNRLALDIPMTPDDFAALDRAFAPPRRKVPLEMI